MNAKPTSGEFAYAIKEGKWIEAKSLAEQWYRADWDDWDPRVTENGVSRWELAMLCVWAVVMFGLPLLLLLDMAVDLPWVGYGR